MVTSIRARNIDKRPWQFSLDRLTMPWADRVVFNSKNVVDFSILNEGVRPEQVVVIPNGVPARDQAPDKPTLRARLGLPNDCPLIGTVGRLRPQKGVEVLLHAFQWVIIEEPTTVLLVIGDGELRPDLERLAHTLGVADSVRFLGERPDVSDILPALDVYAHPALFEGMPNAVMEAMAAGLPVVATDVDGTRELIEDGNTGWLVPSGDAPKLAERILILFADPLAARHAGQAAARKIHAAYSLEAMVAGFDDLYRSLLDKSDRPGLPV